jgi:glycosyltransferase involved in cell wall biosynthesis
MPDTLSSPSAALASRASPPCLAPPVAPAPVPLRVLHVINGEHYAGAERVQDLLALRLPEYGCEAGFACLKAREFPERRLAKSTPLYALSMAGPIDPRPVLELCRIVRREGYSLLHTHGPRAAMVGALASKLTGAPQVHHMHSPASADTSGGWRDRMIARSERLSLKRASAVLTVSSSLGRYVLQQELVPPQRLIVVPNGVPRLERLPSRAIPRDEWLLGAVALFRPRKGLEILLEALAMLRARGRHVRLRAVGGFETPQYRERMLELVDRWALTDAVQWAGFQSDVNRELGRMDLFVLPSLFGEGMPMVVLEAMAAGVPVVATRVEGVPEVIRDEVDGVLATPGDPADLAAAIERVLSGEADWSSLRASAFARQGQTFSDRSMAAAVADAYQHVWRESKGTHAAA